MNQAPLVLNAGQSELLQAGNTLTADSYAMNIKPVYIGTMQIPINYSCVVGVFYQIADGAVLSIESGANLVIL